MSLLRFGLHKALSFPKSSFSTIPVSSDGLNLPLNYKKKCPKKKASSLLNLLRNEDYVNLRNGREWEQIRAGDAVEIERLPYLTAPKPDIVKGIVLRKVNKASDTFISILNMEFGTQAVRNIVIYNPMIKSVKVTQKAFIHEGKKRVRRSKIFYYTDKDPEFFTLT